MSMKRARFKPTLQTDAGRLVRKAARILEDRTWIQRTVGSPEQGMCMVGAINFATTKHTQTGNELAAQTILLLGKWLPGDCDHVPGWNDFPNRTKEEVLLYMNKFADEMDPQCR